MSGPDDAVTAPDDGDGPTPGLSVDDVAALLRGQEAPAPAVVTDRAVGRVRVESTVLVLLRTVGGAWLRVGRALPDLASPGGGADRSVPRLLADELEDTGELPPLDP